MIDRAGGVTTVRASWGIAGRLTQLKLKSGGQLECLYLLIRADGLMHFVAEYTYG